MEEKELSEANAGGDARREKKEESSNTSTKDDSSGPGEGAAGQEQRLDFASLPSTERDFIVKKLKQNIIERGRDASSGSSSGGLFGFFGWLKEQLFQKDSKSSHESLIDILEYLKDHTQNLALTRYGWGNNMDDSEISKAMDWSVKIEHNSLEEQDLKEEEDPSYVAFAALNYIRTEILFFPRDVYVSVCSVYRSLGSKEYVVERLPFVIDDRDVFRACLALYRKQREHSTDDIRKIWVQALIRCPDVPEDMDYHQKLELLNDITDVDWDFIPLEFYN